MKRLNRIAFAALASLMIGLVGAPVEADSRHDRRGGHECCAKRGHDGGKHAQKAYRQGRRDGYREARRDAWSDAWRSDAWRRDDWRSDAWRRDDWRSDALRRDDWRSDALRRDDGRRHDGAVERERGLKRGWRVGERPPRDRVSVIRDHRERRYPRPPRDAYYVSIDRDVFLVAAATGVIIDVLRRD